MKSLREPNGAPVNILLVSWQSGAMSKEGPYTMKVASRLMRDFRAQGLHVELWKGETE